MQIIKTLRQEAGMTQRQLADKLGVSVRSLRAYENQMDMVPSRVLMKLADVFQVSLDYLLGQEDDPIFSNFSRLSPAWQKVFCDLIKMLAEKPESHS